MRAAAVLGRTGPRAVQADGRGGLVPRDSLDHHLVAPAVAEIVLVEDPGVAERDVDQPDVLLVGHRPIDLLVGHADGLAADDVLVEVGVGPAHRDLDDLVEARQA